MFIGQNQPSASHVEVSVEATPGSNKNHSSTGTPSGSLPKRNTVNLRRHSVRHSAGILEITALLIALEERVLCLSSVQQAAEEIHAFRDFISANQKDYPKSLEIVPYYSLIKKLLRAKNSSRIRTGQTPVIENERKEEGGEMQ